MVFFTVKILNKKTKTNTKAASITLKKMSRFRVIGSELG